jgi:hypothetical protein
MKRTAVVRAMGVVFAAVVALVTIHGMGARAVAGQSEALSPQADQRTTCSTASLHGTFGFAATGAFAGSPVARVGWETFDGEGHARGTATTSVNGTIYDHSSFTVTYTVNHNCTGTFTEEDSAIGPSHDEFVIVDGGREIQAVNVDSGGVITAVWKKQFPKGDQDQ